MFLGYAGKEVLGARGVGSRFALPQIACRQNYGSSLGYTWLCSCSDLTKMVTCQEEQALLITAWSER